LGCFWQTEIKKTKFANRICGINMSLDMNTVIYHRLKRQFFYESIDKKQYLRLLKLMQPVSPVYNSCPGSPPSLIPRGQYFDDSFLNSKLRSDRKLVKGRFAGGSIGYVFYNDLELYANAFCKPLEKLNYTQQYIFDAIKSAGPLTPRQLKEETGFLNKEIMPALHRLQKAFLVYEDQVDSDWERSWYIFESEMPEVELNELKRIASIKKIILRLLQVNVFLDFNELNCILKISRKFILQTLSQLTDSKTICNIHVQGLGKGFILAKDCNLQKAVPLKNIYVLHQNDPLVVLEKEVLKDMYKGKEVLQYLMIDGRINGALLGHWQIKPHDIENIEIFLPYDEVKARYKEIEEAVYKVYSRSETKIKKFCGEKIDISHREH
jgi:hypothetical protein